MSEPNRLEKLIPELQQLALTDPLIHQWLSLHRQTGYSLETTLQHLVVDLSRQVSVYKTMVVDQVAHCTCGARRRLQNT